MVQSSWVSPVPPERTTQLAPSSEWTTAARIAGTVSGTIALYTTWCPAAPNRSRISCPLVSVASVRVEETVITAARTSTGPR